QVGAEDPKRGSSIAEQCGKWGRVGMFGGGTGEQEQASGGRGGRRGWGTHGMPSGWVNQWRSDARLGRDWRPWAAMRRPGEWQQKTVNRRIAECWCLGTYASSGA